MSKKDNQANLTPRERAIQKNRKQVYIILAVALIVSIVCVFIPPVRWVSAIGIIVALLGLYFGYDTEKQIKRVYCKHCGEKYDYENDVGFQQEDVTEKEKEVTATVVFECLCRHCGQETQFRKKFVIAAYNQQKGTWKEHDLRTMCRKYFKTSL